jgi:hypothetical protein
LRDYRDIDIRQREIDNEQRSKDEHHQREIDNERRKQAEYEEREKQKNHHQR